MGGIVGRFFFSFGMTIAFSLLVSLLVSLTLTPTMASRLLRGGQRGESKQGIFYQRVDRLYGVILSWSLRRRWVVVVAGIVCLFMTWPLFRVVGKDFFPADDQSEFEVTIQAPEGTSLRRMDGIMAELEGRVRKLRGVQHLLTTIGDTTGRVGRGEGDVTSGRIFARLVEIGERDFTQFEVMEEARRILADYPNLRGSVQGANQWSSGGARNPDLEFNIRGPDLQVLEAAARRIASRIAKVEGFVDVDTTLAVRRPEVRVTVDRAKASDLGIPLEDVASALRTLVGGEAVSKYQEGGEQYDVWLRAEARDRADPKRLGNLTVLSPGAGLIRLSDLARFDEEPGPSQIDRLGRQRRVTVIANLVGVPIGAAVDRVREITSEMELPPAYRTDFSGRAKTFREMGVNFMIAFLLSAIFMYMILAAQFESLLQPLAIMLALPVTIPFALISLLLIGDTLNLYSILGLFMLLGIVKKNGILQIDYSNTLRRGGMDREQAIVEANHTRLRPILMTTLMLVAGMIPIAVGTGPGAASRASMAKVIIGGQILSLLLSLLVTPVAYSLFDDFLLKAKTWKGRFFPSSAAPKECGD
jgi:HAE1 family hydrophobic/amphiphilic exporter-1